MENKDYLKILKSQLRPMDHKSRQNILNEISAAVDDAPEVNLENRFGSVYQLSAQYLEDMPYKATWWERLGSGFKWLLIGLGFAAFSLIIISLASVFWFGDDDDFDYSDLTPPELEKMNWVEVDILPKRLMINDSEAIIYTGDYARLNYSCSEGQFGIEIDDNDGLILTDSKCFLKVPKWISVDARNANIVLTELKNDLSIKLSYSNLELATMQPILAEYDLSNCTLTSKKKLSGGEYKLSLTGKNCKIVDYGLNQSKNIDVTIGVSTTTIFE